MCTGNVTGEGWFPGVDCSGMLHGDICNPGCAEGYDQISRGQYRCVGGTLVEESPQICEFRSGKFV